jgi:hypothetical protein
MHHSLKASLYAAGIAHSEIEVDHHSHSIRVSIGPGDDGQLAAEVLWHGLPVGIETRGSETFIIDDLVGGIHPVSLDRLQGSCLEVSEDEPYNARGRVLQPLEPGFTRFQPTTKTLTHLYEQGCVGWDIQANAGHLILFVDEQCPPVTSEVLAHPARTSEVRRFPFTQPKPENWDYMTVKHASQLLNHTVREILQRVGPQGNFVDFLTGWGVSTRRPLLPGPRFLTVDTDSLHAYLVDRGCVMEGSPEVGDPAAYATLASRSVSWSNVGPWFSSNRLP